MFCSLTLVLSKLGVRVPNVAVFCLVSCSAGMLPRLLLLLIQILLLLRPIHRNGWDRLFRIHLHHSFKRPFSLLLLMLVWNSHIVRYVQMFQTPGLLFLYFRVCVDFLLYIHFTHPLTDLKNLICCRPVAGNIVDALYHKL